MEFLKVLFLVVFIQTASCSLNRVGFFEYKYYSSQNGLQTIDKAIYISDIKRNFTEARNYCQNQGLELLALYSSDVNPAFNKYNAMKRLFNADHLCLEEYTIIGGTRFFSEEPWKLLNGRPINYVFEYAPREPNNPDKEFCLSIRRDLITNAFGMNDIFCNQQQKFICEEVTDYSEMDVEGSELVVTFNNRGAELAGFSLFGQFEYEFDTTLWGPRTALTNVHYSNKALNFEAALKSCASKGLKMLTLESSIYNKDFNKNKACQQMEDEMFKNLNGSVFFGVRRANGKSPFQLADGSPMRYETLNYAPGEPSNTNNNENCLTILSGKRGVNDDVCTNELKYFCEEPLDFDWVDQPGFSSLKDVNYRPIARTCGLITSTIQSRIAQNNGTDETEPVAVPILTTLSPLTEMPEFSESV